MATLIFFIDLHFKKNSMANIVIMKSVSELDGARVTMDTALDLSIFGNLAGGEVFQLQPYLNGLYYLDLDTLTSKSNTTKTAVNNYSLL